MFTRCLGTSFTLLRSRDERPVPGAPGLSAANFRQMGFGTRAPRLIRLLSSTWKQFANPENWKSGVLDKLADPNTPVHFNLNGVDVWSGVQRAASGGGGATDWELVQIMQNQQFWESTTFWQNGQIAPNPFQ